MVVVMVDGSGNVVATTVRGRRARGNADAGSVRETVREGRSRGGM